MSKVKVAAFSVSMDGFGAGPDQSLQHPLGVRGTELHEWFFKTHVFQKMLFGREGGSTGINNDIAQKAMDNLGAWIFGSNLFSPGRGA